MTPRACPKCGTSIPVPHEYAESWSGRQKNGKPAGGAIFRTKCPKCDARLTALENVYDESGNIPDRPEGFEPELIWQENFLD
jgi:hypothetical protein